MDTHGVTGGSQLPVKSGEPILQPSQKQDLPGWGINRFCFLTKGVDPLTALGGGGLHREVPLPPPSPGCAWELASALSAKKKKKGIFPRENYTAQKVSHEYNGLNLQ